MKLTDRRLVARVGIALVAVSAVAFGMGVNQGRHPPSEPAPLPIPAGLVSSINLQSVPNATALAPGAANAVDPSLKIKPHKSRSDEDNSMDDSADDAAPPAPEPLPTAPAPPPQPAQSSHGPY